MEAMVRAGSSQRTNKGAQGSYAPQPQESAATQNETGTDVNGLLSNRILASLIRPVENPGVVVQQSSGPLQRKLLDPTKEL
jgi:hypothetical protein